MKGYFAVYNCWMMFKQAKKGLTLVDLCCGAEEGAEKNQFVV